MRAGSRAALLILVITALPARAAELGNEGDLLSVEIHAFASQGFILTTSNNYLADDTTTGSFHFSEVGLNFSKTLTDTFKVGLQLFAQDLGTSGSYDVKLDWFYIDYRWKNWLGLRVGRVKLPFGLYNEINDIDAARVPILLPQSVYPVQNRNYLLAQTGAELYGYVQLGGAGALDYRAYSGTIFLDIANKPGSAYQVKDIYVSYIVGGRLLWETPLDGLRFAGSMQALRIQADLLAGQAPVHVAIPAVLWVASAEYSAHDLQLSAEYCRWYIRALSSAPTLFPNTEPSQISERAYVMASYHLLTWLQPGAYFSLYFPDIALRGGREHGQRDTAATLRFDINPHWLIKLEGHYLIGTAALSPALNSNVPLSQLRDHWAALLLTTTAHF